MNRITSVQEISRIKTRRNGLDVTVFQLHLHLNEGKLHAQSYRKATIRELTCTVMFKLNNHSFRKATQISPRAFLPCYIGYSRSRHPVLLLLFVWAFCCCCWFTLYFTVIHFSKLKQWMGWPGSEGGGRPRRSRVARPVNRKST